MAKIGEKMFTSEGFKFFFDMLEDLIKQRANSSEVGHLMPEQSDGMFYHKSLPSVEISRFHRNSYRIDHEVHQGSRRPTSANVEQRGNRRDRHCPSKNTS